MRIEISNTGNIVMDFGLPEAVRERLCEKAFSYAIKRADEAAARNAERMAVADPARRAEHKPEPIEVEEVHDELDGDTVKNGHDGTVAVDENVSVPEVAPAKEAEPEAVADEDDDVDIEPPGTGTVDDPVDASAVARERHEAGTAREPVDVAPVPAETEPEPEPAKPARKTRRARKAKQAAAEPAVSKPAEAAAAADAPPKQTEAAQAPEPAGGLAEVVKLASSELATEESLEKVLTWITEHGVTDADQIGQVCEALADNDQPACEAMPHKVIAKAIRYHVDQIGA